MIGFRDKDFERRGSYVTVSGFDKGGLGSDTGREPLVKNRETKSVSFQIRNSTRIDSVDSSSKFITQDQGTRYRYGGTCTG